MLLCYLLDLEEFVQEDNMNRLSLVILFVCLSAVLINNQVDAFFKAGRSLHDRQSARQVDNALEGEFGAADARELWEEFVKARSAERKRAMKEMQ